MGTTGACLAYASLYEITDQETTEISFGFFPADLYSQGACTCLIGGTPKAMLQVRQLLTQTGIPHEDYDGDPKTILATWGLMIALDVAIAQARQLFTGFNFEPPMYHFFLKQPQRSSPKSALCPPLCIVDLIESDGELVIVQNEEVMSRGIMKQWPNSRWSAFLAALNARPEFCNIRTLDANYRPSTSTEIYGIGVGLSDAPDNLCNTLLHIASLFPQKD